MNASKEYDWLIVVEGDTDEDTYGYLFHKFGVAQNTYSIFAAKGKANVCATQEWNRVESKEKNVPHLLATVENDVGRSTFKGIILVIDSDTDGPAPFAGYSRNDTLIGKKLYKENTPPKPIAHPSHTILDTLLGVKADIPIIGISVPLGKEGCLESELLESHGFPIKGQREYCVFVDLIMETSRRWKMPPTPGGGNWWDENHKAKMDKFIYVSLCRGFNACHKNPNIHNEPNVIKNIKLAMA